MQSHPLYNARVLSYSHNIESHKSRTADATSSLYLLSADLESSSAL
jgi:hypothetical protein